MMTRTEVETLAQAINALRPDWPIPSLCSFLRRHEARPLRDVALELTYVALDAATKTPARIEQDGPWKTVLRPGQTRSYRVVEDADCATCWGPAHPVLDHVYEPQHVRDAQRHERTTA